LIDLGQFYVGLGRVAEAEAMAKRAEKACEDVPIGQERFSVLGELSAFYSKLGDVSRNEALYNRLLPMRRAMPFSPDLVWVEKGLAEMDAARGRFPESEDHYRLAIGILDHNDRWKEEADALEALASVYKKGGKRPEEEAAEEQAKSLRARP
jgi:tetratricopeptide (TPR) repeat protein